MFILSKFTCPDLEQTASKTDDFFFFQLALLCPFVDYEERWRGGRWLKGCFLLTWSCVKRTFCSSGLICVNYWSAGI